GLSPGEVAKVIGFCIMTLWLGFFAMCGVVFLYEPMTLPRALHLPFSSVRPIGALLLALVLLYFLGCSLWRDSLKIKAWNLRLPSAKYFGPQMGLAFVHWAMAGSVVFILLPPATDLTYGGFMGIYLLAQLAGLLSQVPGGLHVKGPSLFGALLAFRGIYYILPLLVASFLFAAQELIQKKDALKTVARALRR
ncbi:MAG: UPF0104 family protein, partial [Deltaproteobacteria bacterium]|nr:UPF0104 family protein [Deltaproteobacteria bacterium]